MDQELPQTLGYEAAGIVDEVGDGVSGVAVGNRVFGASPYGAAQAELAVLSYWAPIRTRSTMRGLRQSRWQPRPPRAHSTSSA